jgi:hypothetical protein
MMGSSGWCFINNKYTLRMQGATYFNLWVECLENSNLINRGLL